MSGSGGKLLKGRAAIVTGAGHGRGAAIARALAGSGAQVCVSDLNPDRADRVAGEIVACGGEAYGWQADVSSKFQVAALIETARDRCGRLDILAGCAHVSPRMAALTMDEWEWRRTLEVNLTGAFFCAQLAGRVMADEGGGLILLLGETGELPGQAAYAMTQAGLARLVDALAAEWGDQGVRVAVVAARSPEEAAERTLALCVQHSTPR